MTSRLLAVTFDVADASTVAAFWAELLDRDVLIEPSGTLVPGDATQIGLRFVTSDNGQAGPRRLHLHLTSRSLEDQQRTVDMVLHLGGRHIDVGQASNDPFVVLADPGDNKFCVIEPGNNFLADTGPLGEVTCDGTRDVGLFWRDALDWQLVWDENEETAVQSPLEAPRSHGAAHRWSPSMDRTGSASTWLLTIPAARPNASSRWAPPGFATWPAVSS